MKAKMQIYAEILRQLGQMPNEYEEPDLGEMEGGEMEGGEPEGHHYESPKHEAAEEKGAKMLLGEKAEHVRKNGESRGR